MNIDFLIKVFLEKENNDAIIWKEKTYSYKWLYKRINYWIKKLNEWHVKDEEKVIIEADFSPNSISILLALIEKNCIIIPLTATEEERKKKFISICQARSIIKIDEEDNVKINNLANIGEHELYTNLRNINHPGLVLFSSGSSGESKAAVHDFINLLEKYKVRKHNLRTLCFLLFDNIGGIDTMFYTLSNGSCLITLAERSPNYICSSTEKYKAEVLPVTPTFLNLLILSEDYKNFDLSSLKYITYGTEVMPEYTLKKVAEIFPRVNILQKFGTTEVGTLRSKSKNSDSLWVKIGGEGFETRIVNGFLEIKAKSAMLGYLNAPSPFTSDGWFMTGDQVIQDGEYLKILGRKSDIINVGGEKVFPYEIENVIYELDNVSDVTVYSEKNPIIGNIICAKIRLVNEENIKDFTKRLKLHCRKKLRAYMVPVKVVVDDSVQHTDRFKKKRI